MMPAVQEGTLLWTPDPAWQAQSNLRHFMSWLAEVRQLGFADYEALWAWSVADVPGFWSAIWDYFDLGPRLSAPVLPDPQMPGATWFPGAQLNYAATIFRQATPQHPALFFQSEARPLTTLSWDELAQQAAAAAAALRDLGVGPGDRVVAYLPNIPEAVTAFLACAALGAIWSSCSPDFGTPSVLDRFQQIEPKVLFAVDGYQYGGRAFDRRAVVAELQAGLPSLQHTVLVPYLDPQAALAGTIPWAELGRGGGELTFTAVPFDHPLWVLYSSGTTGLPKPIVHGHGGILLEHLKTAVLHFDLKPDDRFFWFTTTGWMMWNFLLAGLLAGCPILLYDGSPAWPDLDVLWRFAEQAGMTFFGTSARYLLACQKAGLHPGQVFDLRRLRGIGSTGSPLPPEGFQWVYEAVKEDLWLVSFSGGTDLCTGFVGGCPLLPVYAGEIQCRCLGAAVQAFDENGRPLLEQVGELVITRPMPSMPLYFWNDPEMARYRESYFAMYPGVWRHGDWIKITRRGGVIIYGRSDATINRLGVRMGTSEIYRAVEALPEVLDSLVVDLEDPRGDPYMPLFVVLAPGVDLDEALQARIKETIRAACSPRHVPDAILSIPEVPRTLSGKKLELPVKRILQGQPVGEAASPDATANPAALSYFTRFSPPHGR